MKNNLLDLYNKSLEVATQCSVRAVASIKKHGVAAAGLVKKGGAAIVRFTKNQAPKVKEFALCGGAWAKTSGQKVLNGFTRGGCTTCSGIRCGSAKICERLKKSGGFIALKTKNGTLKFGTLLNVLYLKVHTFLKRSYGVPVLIFTVLALCSVLIYALLPHKTTMFTRGLEFTRQQVPVVERDSVAFEQKLMATLDKLDAKLTLTEERVRQYIDNRIIRVEQQLQKQEATLAQQQRVVRSSVQRSRVVLAQQVQSVAQKQDAVIGQLQKADDSLAAVEGRLAVLDAKITSTEQAIKQQVDVKVGSLQKAQQQQAATLRELKKETKTQTIIVQRNTGAVDKLEKTIKKTKFAAPTKATVNERIRNEVNAQLAAMRQQKEAIEEKEDVNRKKKQLKKLLKEVLD